MREIKFRAWDGKSREIFYPADSNKPFGENDEYWGYDWGIFNSSMERLRSSGAILMQYTGLKDRNGREIYEGDICRVPARGVMKPWICEVKYLEVNGSDDMGTNMIGFPRLDEYGLPEIIGNIYEHSYLLDTKAEK